MTNLLDYILVDSKTAEEVEEIIVDEIGTHRLRGKRESDHNTILMTLKQKNPTYNRTKIIEKRNPRTMGPIQQQPTTIQKQGPH